MGAGPTTGWKWAWPRSPEQVLGLGKEDWLLEIMSKILQRDRNKSLKKEERGSQGPPALATLEQGSQAEPRSRTAAWALGVLTSSPCSLEQASGPQPCSLQPTAVQQGCWPTLARL